MNVRLEKCRNRQESVRLIMVAGAGLKIAGKVLGAFKSGTSVWTSKATKKAVGEI